jgi:hypothetical protein
MSEYNTVKWADVFDKFITNYNNTIHSSIKLEPAEVSLEKEKEILDDKVEKYRSINTNKDNIQVGDKVRLPITKAKFQKEGQRYSSDLYEVAELLQSKLKVRNSKGNLLKKEYSINLVQKVDQDAKENDSSEIIEAKTQDKSKRNLEKEGLTQEELLLAKARSKLRELIKSKIVNKDDVVDIKLSDKPDKKLMVELRDGKIIHFGAKNSLTFLEGADENKKKLYQLRASKIKNKQGRFTYKLANTANFWAFHILWT